MTRRWLAVAVVGYAIFGGIASAAAQSSGSKQWGAIAFSQDGTNAIIVKYPSRYGASDKAMARCEDLRHGRCQVVEVPGDSCAALATYIGPDPGKRNNYSRSGVGDSKEVAERLALINAGCEKAADRDNCRIKASFCVDGRDAVQTTNFTPPRNGIKGPDVRHDRMDFIPPPSGIKIPERGREKADFVPPPGVLNNNSAYYGAIAFTADGSWATVWKAPSKPIAEADVAKRCSKLGHGGCEVVSFPGEQCVALATFIGRSGRKRWQLSFTAGGLTGPEAQLAAMKRCNDDSRARGRCQLRTMVCGDGR
jgi:Domain of unknown function (DUF4189)